MLEIVAPQPESMEAGGETAEVVRHILQADPVQVNQLQLAGPRQVWEGIGHPGTAEEPAEYFLLFSDLR